MSSSHDLETLFQAARQAFRNADPVALDAACARILAASPGYGHVAYVQGVVALECDQAAEAVRYFRSATDADPRNADFHHALAAACYKAGDPARAESGFRKSLELAPGQVNVRLKLASLLFEQRMYTEALAEYGAVYRADPENIEALFQSSRIHELAGNYRMALAGYQQILRLQPENAEVYNLIGALLHAAGEFAQAVPCYRKAVELNPGYTEAHNNLGSALSRLDEIESAAESYRNACRSDSPHASWLLRIASLCQTVPMSTAEIVQYRQGLQETLDDMIASGFSASPAELVAVGAYPPYALMYHGLDDRPLREKYASLYQPSFPVSGCVAGSSGQRRIGLVVTRGHEEIFARSLAGILRHIDTASFRLVVVCTAGREALVATLLSCTGIEVSPVPEEIGQMAQAIRGLRFDVLYYWEIATDPVNYFLPFYRLAPVQCTSWGIQVTSGIETVDYYLSSALVEPPGAASRYTETLLCADTLLTFQYRSKFPATGKTRSDFGIDEQAGLYLFPQQIGKFHPDFDAMVGDILRADRRGRVYILRDRWPHSALRLQKRLSVTIPDVCDRVVFLPRLDSEDYLALVALADVLLDPPHYGGVNSSYDGFSLNTPIVTLESGFHIGRYTAACYRKMQLADCIPASPEEYVNLAVQLATEPDTRQEFCQRLSAASDLLFEDMFAVHEHERLFNRLLDAAG